MTPSSASPGEPRPARAERWVRRLADDWEFDEGRHLSTVLAELDRLRVQRDAVLAYLDNCAEGGGSVSSSGVRRALGVSE